MRERRILLTGAVGRLGRVLAAAFRDRYELRLTDLQPPPADDDAGPFILADLGDAEAVRALCQDVDTVLHLAASSDLATPWEPILRNNIIGCSHLFHAASEAGCRRIVFASSIHAGGFPSHPPARGPRQEPRTLYGASKAWGEALANVVAHRGPTTVLCLRLGWVMAGDDPLIHLDNDRLDIILTHEDLTRLCAAAIEAPDDLRYGIFYGLSNNERNRYDLTETRTLLAYAPRDDAFAIARAREPAGARGLVRAAKRVARRVLRGA
jgi:nucleoside-diphosphate-sugar epimerase